MKRWIRRAAMAVATLIALAAVVVASGAALAVQRLHRHVDVPVAAVPARTTPQALEQGRYLFKTRGCAGCHGAEGRGALMIDGGPDMRVFTPHIARGTGSVTAAYRDEDWERAIRHGVKPDGRPLLFMPSQDYNRLTDADLGALIGYIRSLPEATARPAEMVLPLAMRVMYGFGLIPDAAAQIDHRLAPDAPVPVAVTVEHGRYVAQSCVGCHGTAFVGGRIPGGPPSWPPAADLTPAQGAPMSRYADVAAFRRMLDSGARPDGTPLKVMPFESLRAMSATDVEALFVFLKSLPPSRR